jgi:hypothetical protein
VRAFPPRDPRATDAQIDLSSHYNCALDEDMIPRDTGNTLAEVPRGLQVLGGVAWDIRGMVQLGNRGELSRFPRVVSGITIGRPCRALHFLQAAEFASEPADAELARYVIRYADGEGIEVPVLNGRDIADWWRSDPEPPLVAAWQGANALSRSKGKGISLFKMTWVNPHPDRPIASLDFRATATGSAAPFVVAITAE